MKLSCSSLPIAQMSTIFYTLMDWTLIVSYACMKNLIWFPHPQWCVLFFTRTSFWCSRSLHTEIEGVESDMRRRVSQQSNYNIVSQQVNDRRQARVMHDRWPACDRCQWPPINLSIDDDELIGFLCPIWGQCAIVFVRSFLYMNTYNV